MYVSKNENVAEPGHQRLERVNSAVNGDWILSLKGTAWWNWRPFAAGIKQQCFAFAFLCFENDEGIFHNFCLKSFLCKRNRAKTIKIHIQEAKTLSFFSPESVVQLILCYVRCIIQCTSSVFFRMLRQEFSHYQSITSLRVTVETLKEVQIQTADCLSFFAVVSKFVHDGYWSLRGPEDAAPEILG